MFASAAEQAGGPSMTGKMSTWLRMAGVRKGNCEHFSPFFLKSLFLHGFTLI